MEEEFYGGNTLIIPVGKGLFLCFPWKFKFINTLITATPVYLKFIIFEEKMPSCLFNACCL